MKIIAESVDRYIEQVPDLWKEKIIALRNAIRSNIPQGFEEQMNDGMIGYVVPHSLYPDGYHCNPKLPLPFANIAAQSKHIGFYHMGLYADPKLLQWFKNEYPKFSKYKLNMGKSCVKFSKSENIPYKLIGSLMTKMSVTDWIKLYEKNVKK